MPTNRLALTTKTIFRRQKKDEENNARAGANLSVGISMTKIIGVIQVKGGAGRSTISTNLAGELSRQGKTVLIDCDMPQGTSASWFVVRQQADTKQSQLFSENLIADTAANHR